MPSAMHPSDVHFLNRKDRVLDSINKMSSSEQKPLHRLYKLLLHLEGSVRQWLVFDFVVWTIIVFGGFVVDALFFESASILKEKAGTVTFWPAPALAIVSMTALAVVLVMGTQMIYDFRTSRIVKKLTKEILSDAQEMQNYESLMRLDPELKRHAHRYLPN